MAIYDEIKAERERQDAKWGGPEHDDTAHSTNTEWVDLIYRYLRLAVTHGGKAYRERMVQVAALTVAAIESYDRATTEGPR